MPLKIIGTLGRMTCISAVYSTMPWSTYKEDAVILTPGRSRPTLSTSFFENPWTSSSCSVSSSFRSTSPFSSPSLPPSSFSSLIFLCSTSADLSSTATNGFGASINFKNDSALSTCSEIKAVITVSPSVLVRPRAALPRCMAFRKSSRTRLMASTDTGIHRSFSSIAFKASNRALCKDSKYLSPTRSSCARSCGTSSPTKASAHVMKTRHKSKTSLNAAFEGAEDACNNAARRTLAISTTGLRLISKAAISALHTLIASVSEASTTSAIRVLHHVVILYDDRKISYNDSKVLRIHGTNCMGDSCEHSSLYPIRLLRVALASS
mmetsp:Transcript_3728/g.13449  ORF Transcript_3728/g.13449 Transcript_3728/m.13449 type:complete len:322 (-) Transcript_3728:1599-2564(-)